MSDRVGGFDRRALTIGLPSQYGGEMVLGVTATQLATPGTTPAQRRRILAEWIEFLSSAETNIRELQFHSRVPQELLDAVAGQPQLEALLVKWGPYRNVDAVGSLRKLTTLRLGGATALETLAPLRALPDLVTLAVSQGHKVSDVDALSEFTGLTRLMFGNDHPGDDRNLVLADFEWARPLRELRSLAIPGTRLLNPDLSPLLDLPHLEDLLLPLRRDLRAQVFTFAGTSEAFAGVAREYEAYESWRTARRT